MRVLISGTAGAGGWPAPGCGCASCARLLPGHRRPTEVVLGVEAPLRLPLPEPGRVFPEAGVRLPPGYLASAGPDGLVVTAPSGHRILHAAPPGHAAPPASTTPPASAVPSAPGRPAGDDGAACDLVLIDPLDRPERLGDLRRRGVLTERTHVVAVGLDHRVPSEAELARRALLWGVRAVPDGTVLDLGEPAPARPAPPRRTLLMGGTRSGKSAEAELRLAAEPEVLYVATGPSGAGDAEWERRIRAHRDRRPAHWATVETTDLAGLLRTSRTPMLIDGLGTWIAAVFDECGAWPDASGGNDGNDTGGTDGTDGAARLEAVAARCDELVAAWRQARSRVVAVSDEVGLGVVPVSAGGRMFRDALGGLNQRLALESEDVALVVAGRLLPLPV
ncbi:bifunctional adenosylcobinamide kinase/adenosylcobinamide-phosphate guanylyltransferase [Streptosporangium sp. NPDC051022]|uniref:bifunctional adenosylcobinamide kinase/adenosylcobinamide-phosphate guanylyltransferase n=1 Tax=Streptosporangium sp. NPDC051022 TaxID=3155752 RepID=UPI003432C12A